MEKERSSSSRIVAASAGLVKLGQPQPDSNFVEESKRGVSQQTQR
jgi:hypothetical protein